MIWATAKCYNFSLHGRIFLGFRVVLGTIEITRNSKDLISQCLDAPDGRCIVVQALGTSNLNCRIVS